MLCNKTNFNKFSIRGFVTTRTLPTGIRIETKVYSKLERPQPHHSSPHELLSVELSRSGNEFGSETQYGQSVTLSYIIYYII